MHFGHVLERDPSLRQIEVCIGDSLVRRSPAEAWRIEEDFEARTRRHIAQFGWSVVHIAAEVSSPAFAYTLGLWETLAHPELIVIGFRRDTAHTVLNDCGGRIRQGEKLRAGMVDQEVLRGYPVVYVDMRPEHAPTWTGAALRHYRAKGIPHFLQIVWPDRDGRFPWDRGAPEDFRKAQPVLGTPPNQ